MSGEDTQHLTDFEMGPDPAERARALLEATERIRSNHDRTMRHSPTTSVGYCAEPDGISAAYCEVGILLRALAATPPTEGLDVAPHPNENHEFRTTCKRCGEAGTLVISLITDDEQVRTEPRAAATHEEEGT